MKLLQLVFPIVSCGVSKQLSVLKLLLLVILLVERVST